MNQTLRHLFVAAAIGVTSFGAYAQTNTTTPPAGTRPYAATTPSTATDVSTNVQAEADYRAAVAACDAQTGSAKAACLSDAEKARDRAMGANQAPMSSGQGTSGTSSGTSSNSGTSGASGGTSGGGTGGQK